MNSSGISDLLRLENLVLLVRFFRSIDALNSFVLPMDKKNKGERKPSELTIERVNSQGHSIKYRIIDNATRLHTKVGRGSVHRGPDRIEWNRSASLPGARAADGADAGAAALLLMYAALFPGCLTLVPAPAVFLFVLCVCVCVFLCGYIFYFGLFLFVFWFVRFLFLCDFVRVFPFLFVFVCMFVCLCLASC